MEIENHSKENLETKASINSLSTINSLNSSENKSTTNSTSLNSLNTSKKNENNIFNFYFNDEQDFLKFSGEYANEIYVNLLNEEKNLNIKPMYGYMKKQPQINEKMRAILIDWIIDLHFKFNLKSQSLYISIIIIDTFLSKRVIARNEFQLLGLTALIIACKTEEVQCPQMKDLIDLTDGACNKESLIKMESDILVLLNYNVCVPTPVDFYGILAKGFKFNSLQTNLGKYFMEYALYDYNMIKYPPSVIAASCCYFVMKFSGIDDYKKLYSNSFVNDECPQKVIKEATRELCFLVKNLRNNEEFKILREKYSLEKYDRVSEYLNSSISN